MHFNLFTCLVFFKLKYFIVVGLGGNFVPTHAFY